MLADVLGAFQGAAVPGWLSTAWSQLKGFRSEGSSSMCPHGGCDVPALLPSAVDPCCGFVAQQWALATN